jgi:8-oxo-dGTP pyrophosphatase MutT (NUDIX family)
MEPSGSRPAFRGRWVRVDEEDWPGVGTWEVVRPLDAACVLPITPDDDVLLVRQFRAAARGPVLEIPAGLLDVAEEDPIDCAVRELFEETGFRHASIELLAQILPSPGVSTERIHVHVARTAARPEGDAEEGIELVRQPLAELVAAARAGELEDGKTVIALLLADARGAPG